MSNLESPGANSSRGLGVIENGESSDAAVQFSTLNAQLEVLEESRDDLSSFDSTWLDEITSEDDLAAPIDFASSLPPESARNDMKRKAAISNHKGVHFRQKNKKFVARLCLPGEKNRKLELGEYNTHDEAARAYQVAAFYYNKSSSSNCGEDHSFLETLPCIPDNLSDAGKMAWVRERARHSAASIGTSESPGICPSKRVLENGGSSFYARTGTPASYGTQGSCDDYHSTPTTPTTPGSGFLKARQCTSESKRRKCAQTISQGSPNVELQQGRNSNALTNQAPVVDHQVPKGQHVAPELRITDIITNSFHELREQGWEVHLQPHEDGNVELISELCVATTGCTVQDKMKTSRFSAWSLLIGSWLRVWGRDGIQVGVKFSYAKQKLVWKVLESGQRRKMEIYWSSIDVMKAIYSNALSDTLQINVYHPPSFFQDMGPQPMMSPQPFWQACTDFTDGEASLFLFHVLEFPPGVLKEHYEKLVQCGPGLKAADIRGQAYASV